MVCPKCGTPIKRFDLDPNCKNCGVHIMYYTQEQDLARDAKKCELEFARGRAILARVKQAYINPFFPRLRLVIYVLAIAVLLAPMGSASLNMGFYSLDFSAGALGIYNLVSGAGVDVLLDFVKSAPVRDFSILVIIQFAAYILCALTGVAVYVAYFLTFLNLEKGTRAMRRIAVVGFAIAAAATVASFIAASRFSGEALNGSIVKASFGGFIWLFVFCAFFVINTIVLKKACECDISDNDKKRIEIAAKVKSGEVTLDELPLPIIPEEKTEKPPKKSRKKRKKEAE